MPGLDFVWTTSLNRLWLFPSLCPILLVPIPRSLAWSWLRLSFPWLCLFHVLLISPNVSLPGWTPTSLQTGWLLLSLWAKLRLHLSRKPSLTVSLHSFPLYTHNFLFRHSGNLHYRSLRTHTYCPVFPLDWELPESWYWELQMFASLCPGTVHGTEEAVGK